VTDQAHSAGKSTEATIQQLNLGYNAEQDRLLLRVGTSDDSELMVWLTYRVARQMWRLFNMEVNLPTATSIKSDVPPANAVEQFNKEVQSAEALNKMDFKTQYQPRQQKLVKDILLAAEIKLIGEQKKVLEIICVGGVSVKVNFGPHLLLALSNMLQLAAQKAGWDMGAPLVATTPAVSMEQAETKTLH
jgi:hypothetical protein